MEVTKKQIQKLSGLFALHNIDDDTRVDLIYEATGGRTESRKGLTYDEAEGLIKVLNFSKAKPFDPKSDKMRKKIIAKFHQMGYANNGKIDMEHVNNTILKYGYLHKPMNDYNWLELPKLVSQVEKMLDDYLKNLRK